MIRIYTTAHVQFLQSLSSFGPNLDEIFEVAERWVVVDYPGADTYDSALRKLCLCAKVGPSGIRPGLSKLTAIVDRKTPANFKAFSLEFTGYFHTLVKG